LVLSWADLFKSLPFLLIHVACVGVFFFPPDATALVLCGVFYFIRMFGITGGYHRYFSHRTYKTSRVFQFVLAWLGCSALQKGPLWWSAHHRQHHRHSDTEHDPHSPVVTSFWWSHVGWILSSHHVRTEVEHVRDWNRYPELRWLNNLHGVPGMALAGLAFWIGGWAGLFWGFFVSTVLLYHATFCVNSLCHVLGFRRYPTKDDSRNNLFVAILTLGEGWHNNHHHHQSSANQGFFWWEIDVSYYLIKTLSLFGVVWDVRRASPKRRVKGKYTVSVAPEPKPAH